MDQHTRFGSLPEPQASTKCLTYAPEGSCSDARERLPNSVGTGSKHRSGETRQLAHT